MPLAHPILYFVLALVGSVAIKVLMSLLRAAQTQGEVFCNKFQHDLFNRDYWVPFFIGTLELWVYPFLIHVGSWQGIGSWLAIKTAAGWRWQKIEPSEKAREVYTNFLFGNALVIAVSFLLAVLV